MSVDPFHVGLCPVCGSPFFIHLRDVGTARTQKPVPLRYCMDCQSFSCAAGYKENEGALRNDAQYNASVRAEKEPYLKQFVATNVLPYTTRYADIGCGVGQLVELFRPHLAETVGYDINPFAIETGRQLYPHITLLDIPFGSDRLHYDFVTLIDVLEHIAEPELFLRNVISHLASRGYLYVTVPRFNREQWESLREPISVQMSVRPGQPFGDTDVHVTHFSTEGLRRLGNRLGLTLDRDYAGGSWPLNGVLWRTGVS